MGLTVVLIGDRTQSAIYEVQAGKTTVKNNNLVRVLVAAEGHKPLTLKKRQNNS
ncbi:VENN motif pre-toxin domain-containing protein [Siccibacter colletis]|uniref:VENN motif pre-toxin domain-containing protein n=1 Tax=Siccibacter colletis TaxID=1505757 RepID=A0ABY6JDR0_9ENTR|nr:VENN motif pre-toxin domain-containing protein [Siccibacter colletis]